MHAPTPKEIGMSIAASNEPDNLEKARRIAHGIGLALGKCSINDIRRVWPGEFPSGNWTGSIFKDKCWERIGYVPAHHTESNGHAVSVWRFKGSKIFGAKSVPVPAPAVGRGRVAKASGDAPATPFLKQPDLFEGAA